MAGANLGNKFKLDIGCINVNSLNVSTLGGRNSKTLLKVEGVTGFKHDVIFLCDLRIKDKENEVKRLFGLNRNACYKLYVNSTKESRGVAVAIKSKIPHEVVEYYGTADENVLLLKIKINGFLCTLGSIYGPNENNPNFFRNLRERVVGWNLPFILGGDFNTILDHSPDDFNLDKIGGGRIPNSRNGSVINSWIQEGNCFEPFRVYSHSRELGEIQSWILNFLTGSKK